MKQLARTVSCRCSFARVMRLFRTGHEPRQSAVQDDASSRERHCEACVENAEHTTPQPRLLGWI